MTKYIFYCSSKPASTALKIFQKGIAMYQTYPMIEDITPKTGGTNGGQNVTITGKYLNSGVDSQDIKVFIAGKNDNS